MKNIKKNSINKNLYLNEVSMFCIPTSIFLTNPKPDLKILPKTKIMLLVDNIKNHIQNVNFFDENNTEKKPNNQDSYFNKKDDISKNLKREIIKKEKENKKKQLDEILEKIRKNYHLYLDRTIKY